jgi:hypothetical protein
VPKGLIRYSMKKFSTFVFLLVVALAIGGSVFLATWDIPAPVNNIERTIPDDKFEK